jgi:hypothetical protein
MDCIYLYHDIDPWVCNSVQNFREGEADALEVFIHHLLRGDVI